MTFHPVKLLVYTLGLALLLPASAEAAKKPRKPAPSHNTAAAAPRCRGADKFPCGPVYFGGYYLGDDPDPFIRSQILRDLGAKFGGPE